MKFIALTDAAIDNTIWLDHHTIESLETHIDNSQVTVVVLETGRKHFVKESPEVIFELIEDANMTTDWGYGEQE